MRPDQFQITKTKPNQNMEISIEELMEIARGPKSYPQLTATECLDGDNQSPANGETFIVVLDRGWVFVGKTTKRGAFYHIENARSIRVWGTTSGLGELRDGPKDGTKLDAAGLVVAPEKSVIFIIKCNRDW